MSQNTTGHTPGPWYITRPFGFRDTIFIQARPLFEDDTVVIVSTERDECKEHKVGRETVSRTYTKKRLPHAVANAHLIAASPDMLAALRLALRHGKLGPETKATVEAAIAKAEAR